MSEQDYKKWIAKPSTYFDSPMDVVRREDIPCDIREKILLSWKSDAALLSVAMEEGMTGGEASRIDEVASALSKLNIENFSNKGPTKA